MTPFSSKNAIAAAPLSSGRLWSISGARRRRAGADVRPGAVAVAGRAVVVEAVDVVEVAADRARAEERQPGVAVDEAKSRLHLAVAAVAPVAGAGRGGF